MKDTQSSSAYSSCKGTPVYFQEEFKHFLKIGHEEFIETSHLKRKPHIGL